MRLWLLTTEYPPQFGGGIGTYCLHTAQMFAEQGHQVTVVTSEPSLSLDRTIESAGNLRVLRFKPSATPRDVSLGPTVALSLDFSEQVEALIQAEGPPDLIECQDYHGIGYFLLQKKHVKWPGLSQVPIVVTLHTPKYLCDQVNQSPVYRFPNYWIGEMERFCIRAADAVLSPSQFLLDEVARTLDLTDRPQAVIPNPFKLPALSSRTSSTERAELVFLGRTEYRKGLLQLIGYLTELWDSGLDLPLHVFGQDTEFLPKNALLGDVIRRKFSAYWERGLIRFEGKLPPDELYSRLASARVVLIPSLFENFPYTVLESMALGSVVLASQSGGQREMLSEQDGSGFLFSHEQPGSFREKLTQILGLTPQAYASVGARARARAQELCAYEAVYPQKLRFLEQVISQARPSRVFPFIRPRLRTEAVAEAEARLLSGKLSVVVPYYNAGAWLRETLDSVLASDYPVHEILIVNDGSDEPESLATLAELEATYPLTVLHQRNLGLPSARNTGARAARGEFIAFIDADDQVEPNFFKWSIDILDAYDNVSFVGSWARYFEGSQQVWPAWNPEPPYLLVHNTVTSGGLIFRTRDFLDFGLNDPAMEYGMEDYESVIRMTKHGRMGVAIPAPLFRYRIRKDSMSRAFNPENQLYLYQTIAQKHPEYYQEFAADIFNLLNANGPSYLYDNPTLFSPPLGYVVPPAPGESSPYGRLVRKLLKPLVPPQLRPLAMWLSRSLARET